MRSSIVSADGTTWALRSAEERDRDPLLRWRNDPAIRARMTGDAPISDAEHAAWFDRVMKAADTLVTVFEIDGESAGMIQLSAIDRDHARARWGFYLWPRPAPRGSGSRMGFLALRHAFEVLALHRVYADVLASNAASRAMHRKLGFVEEGVQREHAARAGGWEDVVLYGVLRAEFEAVQPALAERLFG